MTEVGACLLDRGVALEGMGGIDAEVADGDGVIEHLADHTQAVLGGDGIDGHAAGSEKDVLVGS